jgi:hypothetical protein
MPVVMTSHIKALDDVVQLSITAVGTIKCSAPGFMALIPRPTLLLLLLLLLLLQFTMREVQGGIIGSGLIVMLIGVTGIIKPVLRAISPITVAANIGVLVSARFEKLTMCVHSDDSA